MRDGLAHSMASLMVAESSSLRSDLDLDLALRALVASLVDTQGAPRRSAYFICAFMPDVPSYISAGSRAEAAGRVLVMRQLVSVHHQDDDGADAPRSRFAARGHAA